MTNIDRQGDGVGIPGWRNASVVYACLTVLCFCVWSRFGRATLLYMVGSLGVLFQPIYIPLPASRIFK